MDQSLAPDSSADRSQPASAGRRKYESLDQALQSFRVPLENHALIRRFVETVGISALYQTSGYIKAVRSGGGPDLHIAYGWSGGFISEDEVIDVAGDVHRWESSRKGLWGITHPANRGSASAGASSSREHRDYGTCPECFMTFHANGSCGCSD
ncbi:hypothetical protein [Microbacterium sp.]|uniref:hypothetical protein n=1 Tax=Microbacterium sp. TaxID=51671 RepID=UPI003F9ADF1B